MRNIVQVTFPKVAFKFRGSFLLNNQEQTVDLYKERSDGWADKSTYDN